MANLDTSVARQEVAGSDLMDKGLLVEIATRPAAAVLTYRKIK